MKLNEFRVTQTIENDYVFISDDGIVNVEDEKDFEIQEILKKENNTNCIYIQIDKKKEEEKKKRKEEEEKKRRKEEEESIEEEAKKALNEENNLKKDQTYYYLKCNKCGYGRWYINEEDGHLETEYYRFKGQFYAIYEKYREWGYEGGQKYYETKEESREQLIKNGCICNCSRSKGIKWWSFVTFDEMTTKDIYN